MCVSIKDNILSKMVIGYIKNALLIANMRNGGDTCVKIYPVVAKSGRRTEQAARTEVMPAAVPSIVFSEYQNYVIFETQTQ